MPTLIESCEAAGTPMSTQDRDAPSAPAALSDHATAQPFAGFAR